MKKLIDILSRLWFPLLMLFFLLILTIQVVFGQTNEINEAKLLSEVDQNKKALDVLNAALKTYPSEAKLWYHLGNVQLKTGNRDLAKQSFDKGISLNEKEAINYAGRGHISMLENNVQKAELDFNKALSLSKSKDLDVLKAVATGYLNDPKLADKAVALLEKVKSADQDMETLILLGDAYLAQNNGGKAVTSYEHAAALDAKSARPHYSIGLVYLRSRNFKAAEESFTKAINFDPAYTSAYKELGELYYQMKEGEKAVKAYEKYLSLTDNPGEGNLRYAFFLFMAKNFEKANDTFEALIKSKNVSPVTLRYYAFSLYETGAYAEGAEIFEQYFSKIGEKDIEATDYNYYGRLLLKQNKDSLATLALQKSLTLDNNQPEILQLQGEAYYKTKNYAGAIDAYEKLSTLRNKPVSQDLYTLGRAYYFNNQYDKADTIFQKLIELHPNMSVGYLWEARTKSNLDPESDKGLAKPFYEALIEKALTTPEKSKNDLLEAYSYLGYYHFLKEEFTTSKSYWNKVLAIDPNDVKAKEAIKALQ